MARSEVLCYNRGCGQRFDPANNNEGSCQHHPGAPYFHETYKGWSCCGKKSVDFTEFLNVPGCAKGLHSTVKPEEPESVSGKKDPRSLQQQLSDFNGTPNSGQVVRAPSAHVQRPDFESTELKAIPATITVSANLPAVQQLPVVAKVGQDSVPEGEPCKNGGCKATYSQQSGGVVPAECVHHPGVPIFHEGMKYWSCCQRKTSDFQAFLDQVGCCHVGGHKWVKDGGANQSSAVECRHDWHQTAGHVTVAIYAKGHDPEAAWVKAHPSRLKVHAYFPESAGSFDMDIELCGVISVEDSSVTVTGTKVEIKLKKAEPGSWSRLHLPRATIVSEPETKGPQTNDTDDEEDPVDAIDLDDLQMETSRRAVLSNAASGGRSGVESL